jgi:hypothetical protein
MSANIKYFILIHTLLVTFCLSLSSQTVYQHVQHEGIYDYLDEMANLQFISLQSTVKPYPRKMIAEKLEQLNNKKDSLNPRQKQQLNFYLKDFNKELLPGKNFDKRFDLFYYKDSLFTFSLNPIFGGRLHHNDEGWVNHWWNGAEAFAYVKDWGFYASLRDNHASKMLYRKREHLSEQIGGANFKNTDYGVDYEEMRGGITYTWGWGSAGLIKDQFAWGNSYHGSNIFSGTAPSFPYFDLHIDPVKWFNFRYIHAWLVSESVDSLRSYFYTSGPTQRYRSVYHPKYMAANMFTFTPFKNLDLSVGNSIIYTDIGVHPAYLMPLFFYKAVDHAINAGIDNMNAQMFFDVSSRNIRHLHLYGSLFVDEISVARMFIDSTHSNFVSVKAGAHATGLLPNTSFTIEYSRSNPFAFQHYVKTLTYESNQFNLGHYLTDNAQELFLNAAWKPYKTLKVNVFYIAAMKGNDYTTETSTRDRLGKPFMEEIKWKKNSVGINARFEIINDAYVFATYTRSMITGEDVERYTPEFYWGTKNTVSAGVNFGF